MKKNRLTLLMLSALWLGCTPLWAQTANLTATQAGQNQAKSAKDFRILPVEIRKSPNDQALYQAIELRNGMTVLLISDPKANKSLMSAALPVGSMEDPYTQPGLAHYLEHMILMGSRNYPETNSLDRFLSQNGGRNNASTSPTRTAYYLEVNNNAFDEAVARLADSLAAPLLLEANAKKEVNAVNAEMVRAKSNDGHLLQSVKRATTSPIHPYSNFSVGNLETLRDKEGSRLQTELEQFYQRYYSANLFKAVLYSNQSLEQLSALAARTLGKMANKNVPAPQTDMPLYLPEQQSTLIHYKPLKPIKMLAISFDFPHDEDQFAHKTATYLSYLLANNADGTLSDYLLKNGLADNGVQVTSDPNITRNRGLFEIYIPLTAKGYEQREWVIALLFQQIAQIRQTGIQESYFKEIQESLSQEFQHLQIEKNMSFVEELTDRMLSYPLEHIIDVLFVARAMDKAAITRLLDRMTLENARIMVVGPDVQTNQTTPYMGAPYAIKPISAAQKQRWLDPKGKPELKLPALNPYFTTDFQLNEVDPNRVKPKALIKQTGEEIYAMGSHYFPQEPKVKLGAVFQQAAPHPRDARALVGEKLFNYMVSIAQAKLRFQASVAGTPFGFNAGQGGFVIEVEGYAATVQTLILDALAQFRNFELTERDLDLAKQNYRLALAQQAQESSLNQAKRAFSELTNYPYFSEKQQLATLNQITLADMQKLREKLLAANSLSMLSVGNLSDTQVLELAKQIFTKPNHQPLWRGDYVDLNSLSRKFNYAKQVPHEDNALVAVYMARGYEEIDGSMRASLLRDMIARWYFDDLRTEKQLGYVVSASKMRVGKTSGIQFAVQSPNSTPKAIAEHNQAFFANALKRLQLMSEAELAQYRASLVEKLAQKPESLSEEFDQFSSELNRGEDSFDRTEKLIARVQQLRKQDIVEFFQQTVVEPQGVVFISQALSRNATAFDAFMADGYEIIQDLEAVQNGLPRTQW